MTNFTRIEMFEDVPQNLLSGVQFSCLNGIVNIDEQPASLSKTQQEAVEDAGTALQAIDARFREWSGISADVPTTPMINLMAGVFEGRAVSETLPHFDFKYALPVVSFKDYFEGDPDFSSLYYPGQYRLPRKSTQILRSFAGIPDPNCPKPLFKRSETVVHTMPAKTVVMEPWNAYHGGPTNPAACDTQRGILVVSYDLSKLPAHELAGQQH